MTDPLQSVARAVVALGLVGLSILRPVPVRAGQDRQTPPVDLTGKTLEELMSVQVESVYGASQHDQRVIDAPSSVTIITAEDIAIFGWRTLADVLRNVRGFHVTNDRSYSYLGARGFGRPSDYNSRTLLLIDGHRFNDNVYGGAYVGTEFSLGVDLIDRIEIIRGPGSALYGTNAFFAVINVITRRGGASPVLEVSTDVGTLGSYGGRVTTGWTRRGIDALLSVTGTTSHGMSRLYFPQFDTPASNNGVAVDGDGDRSTSLFGTVTAKEVTIQGMFGTRDKHIPTAPYGVSFNDPRNRTSDVRAWLDVSRRFAVGQTSVLARAAYDHAGYAGRYVYGEGATVNRDFAQGDWVTGEAIARRTVRGGHVLTTGIEYRGNIVQDQWNYDLSTPGVRLIDANCSSQQWAVYGQAEIVVHAKLTATVGGRYDRSSLVGGAGRPRLGLVFTPWVNTAVKLLYGGAYRAPNVYELFYEVPGIRRPTGLEPESLKTAEAVFEHYFGQRLRVSATGYLSTIRNLISQSVEPDGVLSMRNQDAVEARGVEMEAEARWPGGLLLRGHVAFQSVTDDITGARLSNAPRRLAGVSAAVPILTRNLTLASDTQFVGSRLTLAGQQLPGAWLVNTNLRFHPQGSRWTLSLGIANLLDQRYSQPVGAEFAQDAVEQNRRTALARAVVRF